MIRSLWIPIFLSLLFLFGLTLKVFGAEEITLTTPVSKGTITKWRVQALQLNIYPTPNVHLTLIDIGTGDTSTCVWDASTTPTGQAILSSLNTANLTSNPLLRRAMNAAQTRGCIGAGSISGTPD